MGLKKMTCIVGLAVLGSGCMSNKSKMPLEHWQNLGSLALITHENLASDEALVVFIRDHSAGNEPAINIFIEGEYLGSLNNGSYKTAAICAAPTNITAGFSQSHLNYLKLRNKEEKYSFVRGKIYYFKVDSSNERNIKILNQQEAEKLILNLKEQTHTLPRVTKIQNCQKNILPMEQKSPYVIQKYSLQANTLFSYGKSGSNHILEKGGNEIAEIATKINQDKDQISHITVFGHTDSMGSETYNKKLSENRAETIRLLLNEHGVPKQNIFVEGRGEKDLIVTDCQARYPENKLAREECDRPNRRVEIMIYGMTAK